VTGEVERRLVDGDDRAFDLVGEPAVVVVPLGQVAELHGHLADELAVVLHLDAAERFRVVGNQIAEPAHELSPLAGVHGRPVAAGEGLLGGLHGAVGVFGVGPGDQAPGLGGKGIVAFEILAAGGFQPLATDIHLVFFEAVGVRHEGSPGKGVFSFDSEIRSGVVVPPGGRIG
jgi:hypothetical protein